MTEPPRQHADWLRWLRFFGKTSFRAAVILSAILFLANASTYLGASWFPNCFDYSYFHAKANGRLIKISPGYGVAIFVISKWPGANCSLRWKETFNEWHPDPRPLPLFDYERKQKRFLLLVHYTAGSVTACIPKDGLLWTNQSIVGYAERRVHYWDIFLSPGQLFLFTGALPCLWLVCIIPGFVTNFIRRRRGRQGRCIRCGYDLRGSSSRCPECGLRLDAVIAMA